MSGIHRWKHKLQLKNRQMVLVFEQIQREATMGSVEEMGETVLLTFSTARAYSLKEWVSILTFYGRVPSGIALPNDGQTLQELVKESQ